MKTKFSRGRGFSSDDFYHPSLRRSQLKQRVGVDLSVQLQQWYDDDDGSSVGRNLLQSWISEQTQIPVRQGTSLRPLSSLWSSSSIGQIKQIWSQGTSAIKGEQLLDTSILQFGDCQLHGGAEDVFRLTQELDPLMLETFNSVVESMNYNGHKTRLNRFDLFHGHIFRNTLSSRCALIGMLFHCAEYPAISYSTSHSTTTIGATTSNTPILEGINLGFCQQSSTCQPSLDEWRYRNVVWSTWWDVSQSDIPSSSSVPSSSISISQNQAIWHLDGASPEIQKLRMDGSDFGPNCPNAVYEGFLGETLGDVICLDDQLYFLPI
jgi:hypothetical protein